eukprot:747429-Hanusia_phi.AAC.2
MMKAWWEGSVGEACSRRLRLGEELGWKQKLTWAGDSGPEQSNSDHPTHYHPPHFTSQSAVETRGINLQAQEVEALGGQ